MTECKSSHLFIIIVNVFFLVITPVSLWPRLWAGWRLFCRVLGWGLEECVCVCVSRGDCGVCIWSTVQPSNPFEPLSPQLSLQHRLGSENPLWPERRAELGPVVHTGLFIGSESPPSNPSPPAQHPSVLLYTLGETQTHWRWGATYTQCTQTCYSSLTFCAVSHLVSPLSFLVSITRTLP